ncbi:receptor-like protein 43 [Mangifera indica]|uniref:receptor-like protein 43 n=1 Tax=Mangifera indica TaxID=29780 RepID=UPI001CF9B0F9|nr:receptor-like protein 43 [Mangifera indica]
METIRLLISLAAQMKWKIYQLDVKSAFLNGYLEEEVYVEQPMDFLVKGHEDKVLKLRRALYGLKQAPNAWNTRINKYFQDNGFVCCPHEYSLYVKSYKNEDLLLVYLYVDDLIFTGNNQRLFEEFKKAMSQEFEMTNIGLMSYYLGLEVKQTQGRIFISQKSYAREILKKFNMLDCNPVSTPMECGIKLSKFDEGFGMLSRFMEAPTFVHMKTAKRILCYLKGTIDYRLFYSSVVDFKLIGFCDSDFVGDVDDRKNTTSFLRSLLRELYLPQKEATEICIDNKSAQALAKNPVFHDHSKHIDTRILISESGGWKNLAYLNLAQNFLTYIEHHPWRNIVTLNVSNNMLQGTLLVPPPKTETLLLSNNQLTGLIPPSICNLSSLMYLSLSDNNLNGRFPHCFGSFVRIVRLHLKKNDLHGSIPDTFANLSSLTSLDLNGNKLERRLPKSLVNCSFLEVINVGNNKISDEFPYWLQTLPELRVVVLRSNRFHGPIQYPKSLFHFYNLQILDLSHNEFKGFLPAKLFQNLGAMMHFANNETEARYIGDAYYKDSVVLTMKGLDFEMTRIITIFTSIDLSHNNFQGEIPGILENFKSLIVLNLAHNSLTGKILSALANLKALESLDLSSNKLYGRIPAQLERLTFLSLLNLSHNQLSEPIPQG